MSLKASSSSWKNSSIFSISLLISKLEDVLLLIVSPALFETDFVSIISSGEKYLSILWD